MGDKQTLKKRVADIEQQVRDVADYLCSRGDTMPLRDQVESRTRRVLHALAQRGWAVAPAARIRELEAENAAMREQPKPDAVHLPRPEYVSTWTLDPGFVERVTREINRDGWEATMEVVELAMLAAERALAEGDSHERRILSALTPAPVSPECIHMTAEMARNCPTCNPEGFATTDAEGMWIRDMEAGVYDEDAPAPVSVGEAAREARHEIAAEVFQAMKWASEQPAPDRDLPYTRYGNSHAEEKARAASDQIITALRALAGGE
jgi:hypothetical protein